MSTIPFLPLFTAVSWATVAGVGASGLALAPAEIAPEPRAAVAPAAPVIALDVELAEQPGAAAEPAPAPPASADAIIAQVMSDAPPAAPEATSVADAECVAFGVPVAAPAARTVNKASASSGLSLGDHCRSQGGVPGGVRGGVPVIAISPGSGFGAGLPRPSYPESARRAGREGSVTVRFALTRDGAVMVARVARTSGHAELDREALDTVRRRWTFPAGSPPGPFEWTAHFVLQ